MEFEIRIEYDFFAQPLEAGIRLIEKFMVGDRNRTNGHTAKFTLPVDLV